jgi:ketosteroid isomerase-like protein
MMTKDQSVLTRRFRKPAAATMLTCASVMIAALLVPSIARPATQILDGTKLSTTPHSARVPNRVAEKFTASEESHMTTKAVIEGYFASLKQKKGWDSFLAEDMVFTSFTSPIKQLKGKGAYLESTKRFYGGIVTFEVRDLLIDGDKACVLTLYQLQRPGSPGFESNVAEVFRVRDGKIVSFEIYFDSAPFPK